jgi:Na+/H+-dicarboxylate symporter
VGGNSGKPGIGPVKEYFLDILLELISGGIFGAVNPLLIAVAGLIGYVLYEHGWSEATSVAAAITIWFVESIIMMIVIFAVVTRLWWKRRAGQKRA